MRILLDHGVPLPIRRRLAPHNVISAKTMGWERLSNGKLIQAAEDAAFDLLLTTDKNIRYQQNSLGRHLAIVVIGNAQWPVLQAQVSIVLNAIEGVKPGQYLEVDIP